MAVQVTIPHGGLGTLKYDKEFLESLKSPSHTVGLELMPLTMSLSLNLSHHPTRWAWNFIATHTSPASSVSHHPTRWAWNSILIRLNDFSIRVTIPHGGLGTYGWHTNAITVGMSPSHTVGLELPMRELSVQEVVAMSPSHTVGLEPRSNLASNSISKTSPSHTVGLEPCRG